MGFGRGRGPCGRGFGAGRGFGRNAVPYGYSAAYQKPDPEMEKQSLNYQAEALQSELDLIKKRLDEIETKTTMK
jgi:hypothetical protein